ncbi:MutS family DNA mismatch repair protein [soil metagenome]
MNHAPEPAATASPAATYRDRAAQFAAERDRLAARSSLLSNLRVLAFAALVVIGLVIERTGSLASIVAALVTLGAFVALIAAHRRARTDQDWQDARATLNEDGLHRLSRDWDRLPVRPAPETAKGHAYAADLDLYGPASLSQILGPVGTSAGAATLDRWLLGRADADTVRARQDAVRELAPLHDLRETLAVHAGWSRRGRAHDLERFLRWAESDNWLRHGMVWRALAWLLPAATWMLIVLQATGVVAGALWLLPMAMTLAIYFTAAGRARATFETAFGRESMFEHYPEMLRAVVDVRLDAPVLRGITQRLSHDGRPADRHLDALRRIMHLADLRLSSMHPLVFLVTMWDFHVLFSLERWQRAAGPHVRDWLAALGEAEALAALATLAHDQPDWCFPELLPHGARTFDAQSLGHPLLADGDRVCNDVQIGPPGTFLLVTGSNMSGKSTLLRAVGLNAVLAQAGAPCCARTLSMAPLDVHTSIRVQDSLARGVSYFMAELERLKQVVDAAHHSRDAGEARLLFLLEEILHGTNTAESRIAARRVIRHLVDAGAVGAATTHDLDLATEPALTDAARLIHFREHFEDVDGRSTLRFDYRLREGIATSTNALELMRLVGLPADDDS